MDVNILKSESASSVTVEQYLSDIVGKANDVGSVSVHVRDEKPMKLNAITIYIETMMYT